MHDTCTPFAAGKMGHGETIARRGTKNVFYFFLLLPSSQVQFNYCARSLSSVCGFKRPVSLFFRAFSFFFLKDASRSVAAASGRLRLRLSDVTHCHMRQEEEGKKINWQLNDTPCEDDKRHLVAWEAVG